MAFGNFRSILFSGVALAALASPAAADIKIGLLTDLSGATSALTGKASQRAAEMAIADFGGEINGEKITLMVADHLAKPDVGLGIAREWVDRENVNVFLSVDNSAVALAVSDLIKDKDVAMFHGGSSSKLINENCGPNQVMMLLDTTALSRAITIPQIKAGSDKWYFIAVDYALGQDLMAKGSAAVKNAGGEVVGTALHSPQATDFSAFLLEAQSKGAKTIGLATFGTWQNAIAKQAQEFGVTAKLSPYYLGDTDIHSTGLETLQNISGAIQFYWDMNDKTRAFSTKFQEGYNRPPTFTNAYAYEFTHHYLTGVKATGSKDAKTVVQWMRDNPMPLINGDTATIREDGYTLRDVYTYQTKKPADSKGEWDYLEITGKVAAADIATPLSDSTCPLVKK
ncbi:MAG: ABC transporter substrate-binding protein [Mesorhizobium sp.]|nr:ABC transporter substrate-binding protein [Mesorhizobium sp.]